MMTQPERALVSVVIPCYDQARYLGEAIESVLAQQYPRVEIIVVDDGSPDDTAAVASRYAGVRYVRQRNQGLAAARNTGLRASTGDFVVFLDADDHLLPGALDAGLACFTEHPDSAFVFGNFRFMAEDGTASAPRVRERMTRDLYSELLECNYVEMMSTVLFRRAILDDMDGFDASLRSSEDYDLLLRIARCSPTQAHDAMVAEYRRYDRFGRSLSNDPARMLRSTLRVLHAQRPYVQGDSRRELALANGIRFFQDYYGGELLLQTRGLLRDRAWHRALWRMVVLLRHYPRGIVERLARKTREALHPVSG